MQRSIPTAAWVAALSLPGLAADALYFTIAGTHSTASGSGSSLRWITPHDVALVTPGAGSAEPVAVHSNLATLAGDGDGDGFHADFPSPPRIDALHLHPQSEDAPSLRDLFLSTGADVPCAGGGGLGRGDVARIAPGAQAEALLAEGDIRLALGIPETVPTVDVDAFTRDEAGTVYLSFEEGMPVLGGAEWLDDGGVAAIPAAAITWSGTGLVLSVAADSGVVVLSEAAVDARCANAAIANHAGNLVTGIGDVDGLEIDPGGGTFTEAGTFPNLVLCGESLTGGGVVSTAAGGSIAVIGGVPMGTPFEWGATAGAHVGLAEGFASSLDGLLIDEPIARFVLDSKTPSLPEPGTLHFAAGGAAPGLYVTWLVTIFGDDTPGAFQPSLAFPNGGFPEWFLSTDSIAGIVADADGVAEGYVPYAGGVPAGKVLVLQGVTLIDDAPALSAPITLQF
ncbi:MAG: hypothetical protein ACF8XB_10200 [Planctomycetota bacterium JB042]